MNKRIEPQDITIFLSFFFFCDPMHQPNQGIIKKKRQKMHNTKKSITFVRFYKTITSYNHLTTICTTPANNTMR